MIYYWADFGIAKSRSTPSIQKLSKGTKEEIDLFLESQKIVPIYTHVKFIKNIIIKNGYLLTEYLTNIKTENTKTNLSNGTTCIEIANEYIYHYLTSFGTFLDSIKKHLRNFNPELKNKFDEVCSSFYDTYLEYRLMARMRDYIVHYDFPFNVWLSNRKNVGIFCSQKHLLKYSNWNQVKKDISQMQEHIDLCPFIQSFNSLVSDLFLEFLYLVAPYSENAYNSISEKCTQYDLKSPSIISAKNEKMLTQGKFEIHSIDFLNTNELIETTKNHPHINTI